MSRERKSRVWDPNAGVIHYKGFCISPSGKVDSGVIKKPGDLILLDWTGLKDRNGVDIYEGHEINGKFVVKFDSPSFVLVNISNGDIVKFDEEEELKITREYSKMEKNQKRSTD